MATLKFWLDGLPFELDGDSGGGMKYWFDGMAVESGGDGGSGLGGTLTETMPLFTLGLIGDVGAEGTLTETMPLFTISAAGDAGVEGPLTETMPLFAISAAGDVGEEGIATVLMPLFTLDGVGYALDYEDTQASSLTSLVLQRIPPAPTQATSGASLVLQRYPPAPCDVTSATAIVLLRPPPRGGGEVEHTPAFEEGTLPRSPKRFVKVRFKDGREVAIADTTMRDRDVWHAGLKVARLSYVSPIEMELSREGYRGKQCTIRFYDYDNWFRGIANSDTIEGTYWSVFIIDDETRFNEGEPYQIYGGFCVEHGGVNGFEYEIRCEDPLGRYLAEDRQPKLPPHVLTTDEFQGLATSFSGKAAPVALGRLVNGKGIVPNIYMGQVNPAVSIPPNTGVNKLLDVHLFSELAWTKITKLYYSVLTWAEDAIVQVGDVYRPGPPNGYVYEAITAGTTGSSQPTFPTTPSSTVTDGSVTWRYYKVDGNIRFVVPESAYGTDLVVPWKPGWSAAIGVSTNWIDYGTPARRYGGLAFVNPDHRFAKALREGRMQLFMEGYGANEDPNAGARYFDQPEQCISFLICNYLTRETTGIVYAGNPTLDGTHGIIDMDTVDLCVTKALALFPPDGIICALIVGRDGNQEKLFDIVNEFLIGGYLEMGTNRFGQLHFDRFDPDQASILDYSEFAHHFTFSAKPNRDDSKNRVEWYTGYHYFPPVPTNPTPKAGDPLPKKNYPDADKFESGLQIEEDTEAQDWTGRIKRFELKNYVVRDQTIGQAIAQAYKAQFLGPELCKDGPRDFTARMPLIDCLGRNVGGTDVEIKLGSVITTTDREGYGSSGYVEKRCRVRKIVLDTEDWTGELSGRVLED